MDQKSNKFLLKDIESDIYSVLCSNNSYQKLRADTKSLYQPVMKMNFCNEFKIQSRIRNDDLIVLSILSHYMEPEVSILIRMALEDILKNKKGSEDLLLLIESRAVAWNFLLTSIRFNKRRLKGLLSKKNIENTLNSLKLKFVFEPESHPKRLVRHKGYRDKGATLKFDKKVLNNEVSIDIHLRLSQVEKDEYSDFIEYFLTLHLNWLKGLGSSMFTENYYFNSKKGIRYYEDDRIITRKDSEE